MKNSLIKSFITYGIGNILFTLVNLLFVPVFLEKIQIEDYGILSVFFVSSNLIMTFFSISITNGILRAYNEGFSTEKERAWTTTIIIFFIVFGFFYTGASVFFQKAFSKLIFNDVKYGHLFVLCGLVGFTRILIGICSGVLRARNLAIKYVILNLLNVISLAAINIYIIYFTHYTLISIAWGYVINGAFSFLLGLVFIKKDLGFGFKLEGLWYFIKYGVPLGLASVASYFINYGNRYYLINYTTATDVSLMDVAQKISSLVGILLTNAFITAFTPYYLNLYLKVSFEEYSKKINQIILTFSILFCFLSLGLILFQEIGLSLLSNHEYLVAAEFVPYLILSIYFNVLFMMLTMGTNISKKTNVEMYITISILLISIVSNILLIKFIGIYGAVITQVMINLLSLFFIHIYNRKNFPIIINFFKIIQVVVVTSVLVFLKKEIPELLGMHNKVMSQAMLPLALLAVFSLIFYKELISIKSTLFSLLVKK